MAWKPVFISVKGCIKYSQKWNTLGLQSLKYSLCKSLRKSYYLWAFCAIIKELPKTGKFIIYRNFAHSPESLRPRNQNLSSTSFHPMGEGGSVRRDEGIQERNPVSSDLVTFKWPPLNIATLRIMCQSDIWTLWNTFKPKQLLAWPKLYLHGQKGWDGLT